VEEHIRQRQVAGTGKTKYQAIVYFKQEYYGAKSFDDEATAKEWKKRRLTLAANGKIDPVPAKKRQASINQALHRPLAELAEDFLKDPDTHVGENRQAEYRLAASLAAPYTLAHFQGREGGQRLRELRHGKFAQPTREKGRKRPLASQTVRLRMTALMALIKYGVANLPNNVEFKPLERGQVKLPHAHESPRTRLPSDREFSGLLTWSGPDSEFATYLHLVDETGGRLSEVAHADRDHIDFFTVDGQVVGGCLRLDKHKTSEKVGVRYVPLSLFAAQCAQRLLAKSSSGRLFEGFRSNDAICKLFDAACEAVGIKDLQIKDFRRGFINRNKAAGVSSWDMLQVVGASSLLKTSTKSEQQVQQAVGHTDASTTATYSVADIRQLSEVFTSTSRFMRVRAAARGVHGAPVAPGAAEELQTRLTGLLAELRALDHSAARPAPSVLREPTSTPLPLGTTGKVASDSGPVRLSQASTRLARPFPRAPTLLGGTRAAADGRSMPAVTSNL
jgi:integrase